MRRSVSVLVAAVACTVVFATTPAYATYPGKNGRIAFATDPGNSPQILKTIKRHGSELQSLASNALDPNWAPDGTRIVFTRVHASGPTFCSIEISNPDGSGVVDLVALGDEPVSAVALHLNRDETSILALGDEVDARIGSPCIGPVLPLPHAPELCLLNRVVLEEPLCDRLELMPALVVIGRE